MNKEEGTRGTNLWFSQYRSPSCGEKLGKRKELTSVVNEKKGGESLVVVQPVG